jgi:hypothetical protein
MFNPLLFANWRSISRGFTVLCWLAVLILACAVAACLS